MGLQLHATIQHCPVCDINWELVFLCQYRKSENMIAVLMGNEYGFYGFNVKPEAVHSFFCFPARKARINNYGFFPVSNIIAVAIAAGIKGGNKQGH